MRSTGAAVLHAPMAPKLERIIVAIAPQNFLRKPVSDDAFAKTIYFAQRRKDADNEE